MGRIRGLCGGWVLWLSIRFVERKMKIRKGIGMGFGFGKRVLCVMEMFLMVWG